MSHIISSAKNLIDLVNLNAAIVCIFKILFWSQYQNFVICFSLQYSVPVSQYLYSSGIKLLLVSLPTTILAIVIWSRVKKFRLTNWPWITVILDCVLHSSSAKFVVLIVLKCTQQNHVLAGSSWSQKFTRKVPLKNKKHVCIQNCLTEYKTNCNIFKVNINCFSEWTHMLLGPLYGGGFGRM